MTLVDWRHVGGLTVSGALVAGVAGNYAGMGLAGLGAGAVGGLVGGLMTRKSFGHPGGAGWGRAIGMGMLATVAGALAGAIPIYLLYDFDYYGSVWEIAALALVVVFFRPESVMLWVAAMGTLHLLARSRRQPCST